jgi:uncharacterized membrane-anchored protein YhcB (DUF1043 family)
MANTNQSNSIGATGTLIAGMAMGAGAMLLANKSVREKIATKLEDMKDMTQEGAQDLAKTAKTKAKNLGKAASDKVNDIAKNV